MKEAGKETKPLLMVLDSLGQLSTNKELNDTTEGKDTRDMTKAPILKATFRVLTLKAAKAMVPVLITNHVYDAMDTYAPKKISGGSGAIYSSSTIVSISKSKDKDASTGIIRGALVRATNTKNRLAKETAQVQLRIDYSTGLDPYYGLLPIAEKAGVFKKVSTKFQLPDGTTQFGKTIENNPEKYFTKEVLDQLEAYVNVAFAYGAPEVPLALDEEVAAVAAE
jgi:RecA/RadA recombinase